MGKIAKNVVVVGLCGVAGAGKTTVAHALAEIIEKDQWWIGGPARLISFAGPLKEGLQKMGVTKSHRLYRDWAQKIGAGFRAANPDHWVNIFKEQVGAMGDDYATVIVDDVRYANEAALCDIVIKIVPDHNKVAVLTPEQAAHESEQFALSFSGANVRNYQGGVLSVAAYLALVVRNRIHSLVEEPNGQ